VTRPLDSEKTSTRSLPENDNEPMGPSVFVHTGAANQDADQHDVGGECARWCGELARGSSCLSQRGGLQCNTPLHQLRQNCFLRGLPVFSPRWLILEIGWISILLGKQWKANTAISIFTRGCVTDC